MIGKRIRIFRKEKGLKTAEFAASIGISQGSLSDIENEKTKPSAETLASIVRNTDIDPVWLLTGEEKQVNPTIASKVGKTGFDYGKIGFHDVPICASPVSKEYILSLRIQKVNRIIDEGNSRKINALDALLDLIDPG